MKIEGIMLLPEGIRKALSHKNYKYFVYGQIVAVLVFWMQGVTSSWLAYELTGSSAILGTVMFAQFFPSLVLAPVGGIVADKFPKKYVMYCTQSLTIFATFMMGVLIVAGHASIVFLVITNFLVGVSMALESPVRNAYMIELVGKEDLRNAIALNSSIFNLGRMLGPALGGFLIPIIGVGYLYIVGAIGFTAITIALYHIDTIGKPFVDPDKNVKHTTAEGFQYAYKEKAIRYSLIHIGFSSMCMVSMSVLLPKVAVEILSGQSVLLGFLHGASGIGAFIGAMYLATSTKNTNILKNLIVGNAIVVVGFYVFAYSSNTLLSILALMCTGGGSTMFMASTNTLLQLFTPDMYRGRVMSLFSMMLMGMAMFGTIYAGYFGDKIGLSETIFVAAIGFTLSVIFVFRTAMKYARKEDLSM